MLREAFERRMLRRLKMERRHLDLLIQRSVGESSFQAIIRLKEIEEKLLERRSKGEIDLDDEDGSSRVD